MSTPRSLPYPLGVTLVEGGANVAVYSESASDVCFCSFDGDHETRTELPSRTGYTWHGFVPGVAVGTRYGIRVDGPWDPANGLRHNVHKLLLDPHALAISGEYDWDQRLFGHDMNDPMRRDDTDSASAMPRCVVVDRAFDWGDDEITRAPRLPLDEIVALRDARQGLHEAHAGRPGGDPGHLRRARAPEGDPAPRGPRRHLGRADAGAPVRAGLPAAGPAGCRTTGATTRSASSRRTAPTAPSATRAARSPSSSRW